MAPDFLSWLDGEKRNIEWPEKIERAVKECRGRKIKEVKALGYSPYNMVYWRRLHDGLKRHPELLAETSWRSAYRRLKRLQMMEQERLLNTERVKIFSNHGDGDFGASLHGLAVAEETKDIKVRCVILNLLWNPEYHGKKEGGEDLFYKQLRCDHHRARLIIPKLSDLMERNSWIFVRIHPNKEIYDSIYGSLDDGGGEFPSTRFYVEDYPFVWHIPGRSGGIYGENSKYQMHRGNDYEIFLQARKVGSNEPIIPRPNIISAKTQDLEIRLDDSDLPPRVVEEMLAMFHPKEDSWLLDPCCDGGGVLKEAYRLGWNVLGIASNEEEADFVRRRILTARKRYRNRGPSIWTEDGRSRA